MLAAYVSRTSSPSRSRRMVNIEEIWPAAAPGVIPSGGKLIWRLFHLSLALMATTFVTRVSVGNACPTFAQEYRVMKTTFPLVVVLGDKWIWG